MNGAVKSDGTKRETSRRDDQEARRARDIVRLLNRHDELRGVHAMADFIDDAVRWTA
jgi:hypothetical protein